MFKLGGGKGGLLDVSIRPQCARGIEAKTHTHTHSSSSSRVSYTKGLWAWKFSLFIFPEVGLRAILTLT